MASKILKTSTGYKLWKKALNIIEGGTMLYSKNPDRFLPKYWPTYYSKAKGCEIWDLNNKKYFDFSIMSVGTNILGYANSDVNQYVINTIKKGNISTLNSPLDVILAKELLKINPWAQKVKFAKTGGEILAMAVRIARSFTGKNNIAFCGYHGWHDWYLSSNLQNSSNLNRDLMVDLPSNGVASNLKNTCFPFKFNDFNDLKKKVIKNNIGTVIMEIERNLKPDKSFLNQLVAFCKKKKIVLIFDECTSGFRETYGGIFKKYGVNPDIAMYGKSLGNGFPITALVGKKKIMEASKKTFISSTFWTENTGTAAAIKTLKIMKKIKSWKIIKNKGIKIKEEFVRLSLKHNLPIKIKGIDALPGFEFLSKKNTLYQNFICKEMLKKGFLFKNTVYLSIHHTDKLIDRFISSLDNIFASLKKNKVRNIKSLNDFKRMN